MGFLLDFKYLRLIFLFKLNYFLRFISNYKDLISYFIKYRLFKFSFL